MLEVNPFDYYKKYQLSHPILYKLSLVVFSGPGTQASANERTRERKKNERFAKFSFANETFAKAEHERVI
jgi:hypothetical protein